MINFRRWFAWVQEGLVKHGVLRSILNRKVNKAGPIKGRLYNLSGLKRFFPNGRFGIPLPVTVDDDG